MKQIDFAAVRLGGRKQSNLTSSGDEMGRRQARY